MPLPQGVKRMREEPRRLFLGYAAVLWILLGYVVVRSDSRHPSRLRNPRAVKR